VAAIYVIGNNHAPGKSAAVDALATVSATPRRATLPHPAGTTEASSAAPVVAFLGDDWTLGVGASATSRRFTTVVSRGLKLSERNFGLDGAGYAKSTGYRSRVDDVVAAKPAVVVVSGGRNDARGDPATAARQIQTLFADLHRRLPQAVLVALAPFWGDSDLPAELTVLGQAIKQAVRDVGGAYVGLADPIHGHPEFMADQADPNDDGYAAIAAAVEPELAKRLPR
jgi:lysophospholipase L1-like esterase